MVFLSILIFIVAIALPSLKKNISPILLIRISTIMLIYAGALSFNAFYIQSIGSGIGIYSGLFHVTCVSQLLDTFILFTSAFILTPRPMNYVIGTISRLFNKNNNYLPSVALGGNYSLIILFSVLGSLLLVSSSDLISMYLSIELQSFGLYILATLYRDSKLASSAGLKYFLLGGLSSCLILLGAGLIYSYTGLTNLESIYNLISVSAIQLDSSTSLTGSFGYEAQQGITLINGGPTLGFMLIVIGFLFKIAAAPLHNWAPDVYDDSPTIVTIWLTIMPKIAILIFLLELCFSFTSSITLSEPLMPFSLLEAKISYLNINISDFLKNLLLISSLLSLIIGTVLGLVQNKIKRLLAYSTISHVGFILLALAVNTEQSIESFIFYIIQYTLTNLNTFLIILALGYLINYNIYTKSHSLWSLNSSFENKGVGLSANNFFNVAAIKRGAESLKNKNPQNEGITSFVGLLDKDIRFISELKGQFFSNPLLSISLAICLFSMAGIPPLMGFFSKQMVLSSAIQNGYYFISIVAILVSVISASYYLKIVKVLLDNSMNSNSTSNSEYQELNNITHLPIEGEDKNNQIIVLTGDHVITNIHSLLISILTLSLLLFILKPSLLLNSTQLLSLSLFNI